MTDEKIPERIKLQVTYDIKGVEDIRVLEPPLEVRGNYPRKLFVIYDRSSYDPAAQTEYPDGFNDNPNERDLRANGLVLSIGSDRTQLTWTFACDERGHEKRFTYCKIFDSSFIPIKTTPLKFIRNLEYVLSENDSNR